MTRVWFSAAVFVFGVGGSAAQAVTTTSNGFLVNVEPIVGYEFTQRDAPSPHRAGMLIYGARLTAGRPHVAVEGEYTRGNDTEVFATPSAMTVNATRENAMLGVRGTYDLAQALDATLRLGGQASRSKAETVALSGVTTVDETAWTLHPYAGMGLLLSPVKAISISLEATYVFNSLSDFTQNTIRLSTGAEIHFQSH